MIDDQTHRLDKYLTEGERVVVATHRHWFAIAEPLATTTVTLLLIGTAYTAGAPEGLVRALLIGWLVVFGRAIVRVWEWNDEWFVATDQRLLLIYGFIIRKVDMLPMTKVTDMTFRRSIAGRIFGYGTFVLESAGQDQALSDVEFIPNPNNTYLKIVGTIFKTGSEYDEEGYVDTDLADDELVDDSLEARHLGKTGGGARHESYDPWEEEDPTRRPSLRSDIADLGRRGGRRRRRDHDDDRARDEDPDTLSFSMGSTDGASPVTDRQREKRRRGRDPDYSETLYSSLGSTHADPWDEDDHGPHDRRPRWWRR